MLQVWGQVSGSPQELPYLCPYSISSEAQTLSRCMHRPALLRLLRANLGVPQLKWVQDQGKKVEPSV